MLYLSVFLPYLCLFPIFLLLSSLFFLHLFLFFYISPSCSVPAFLFTSPSFFFYTYCSSFLSFYLSSPLYYSFLFSSHFQRLPLSSYVSLSCSASLFLSTSPSFFLHLPLSSYVSLSCSASLFLSTSSSTFISLPFSLFTSPFHYTTPFHFFSLSSPPSFFHPLPLCIPISHYFLHLPVSFPLPSPLSPSLHNAAGQKIPPQAGIQKCFYCISEDLHRTPVSPLLQGAVQLSRTNLSSVKRNLHDDEDWSATIAETMTRPMTDEDNGRGKKTGKGALGRRMMLLMMKIKLEIKYGWLRWWSVMTMIMRRYYCHDNNL